jgi:hypothetical protein
MNTPSWFSKCREWRTEFETLLAPPFREVAAAVAIFHTITEEGTDAGKYSMGEDRFHRISLSCALSEAEARTTYGHEFAHFLAAMFFGDVDHGFIWQGYMKLFGLPAEEFHAIPLQARRVIGEVMEKIDEATGGGE